MRARGDICPRRGQNGASLRKRRALVRQRMRRLVAHHRRGAAHLSRQHGFSKKREGNTRRGRFLSRRYAARRTRSCGRKSFFRARLSQQYARDRICARRGGSRLQPTPFHHSAPCLLASKRESRRRDLLFESDQARRCAGGREKRGARRARLCLPDSRKQELRGGLCRNTQKDYLDKRP